MRRITFQTVSRGDICTSPRRVGAKRELTIFKFMFSSTINLFLEVVLATQVPNIVYVRTPITTLCPCSLAISDYGAHSQRGWVKVRIEWSDTDEIVSPQEVYEKLQKAGSAPIYPLLKRADERHVTMLAYEQPAFVEDTARRAALILQKDPRISNFDLDIRNEESIHTHDAIANLSYSRP